MAARLAYPSPHPGHQAPPYSAQPLHRVVGRRTLETLVSDLPFDPAAFAQRQLDAYNDKDLERFVREYTDDVLVYRMPQAEPVLVGKPALADHYAKTRFNLPHLHAALVNRMVFGNKVIDHERVTGVADTPREVAAVYEVSAGGISKVWFINGD